MMEKRSPLSLFLNCLFTCIMSKCFWHGIYSDSDAVKTLPAKFGSKRPCGRRPLFKQSFCHRRTKLQRQSISIRSESSLNGQIKSDLYVWPQRVCVFPFFLFWCSVEHKGAQDVWLLMQTACWNQIINKIPTWLKKKRGLNSAVTAGISPLVTIIISWSWRKCFC